MFKIEVKKKDNLEGENLKKDILDLGINIESIQVINTYFLFGNLNEKEINLIAEELLTDKVWETYKIAKCKVQSADSSITNYQLPITNYHVVEVAYKPGVMDPVESSILKGIQDMGITGVDSVKTAKKYLITGNLTRKELGLITNKLLLNPIIQRVIGNSKLLHSKNGYDLLGEPKKYSFNLISIPLLNLSDSDLLKLSKSRQLGLNGLELNTIQSHFATLGRNPTDIELETIAQTWSEHCVHKTFKSRIKFNDTLIPPLFTTIKQVTQELSPPWCISVFNDNAGIIKFNSKHAVCFKVETHNHPSALEPYGGAGTGIGGVIRDPLGTGLGAKPILNTDVFCFGPPDYPYSKLPPGILHPKRIMKGVVAGVRDYGNKMGIPTANGAVLFDEGYIGNPVVYCGNVGLMPIDKCKKEVAPDDLIVLIGGRTGRDGIHGVTFASRGLSSESESISSGAVQIGNPISEKKLVDVLLQARDLNLYNAITDCGGGGLSSAVGEFVAEYGAVINLEKVPLKYKGLSYCEIWISEAQERMVIFVLPQNIDSLFKLCNKEGVEATVIGKVTSDHRLRLRYEGNQVADLELNFLHHGLPLSTKRAHWEAPRFEEPDFATPKDLNKYLIKLLSRLNICSKEWVIRQYDHEVQGGSVIKPIVGNGGPGDACVMRPLLGSRKGIVVGCGINPMYGRIDPYWMAGSCVDEAIRNLVAVGANPTRIALLDNFAWGNPDNPERLGELVRSVQGCYDIAKAYGTPFISGKDSLNNEYRVDEHSISIPSTLLISGIGIIEDITHSQSSDLKAAGDPIYMLGETYKELGGSAYFAIQNYTGNLVPKVRPNPKLLSSLHRAMKLGLVSACHDCAEGGLGVVVAEMCFGGGIGMKVWLSDVPCGEPIERDDLILFSESNTRFVVEVPQEQQAKFEQIMSGHKFAKIGISDKTDELEIFGLNGSLIVKSAISLLKDAWQKPLANV